MIDTNTVNFAIDKMGEAISAAAPTLKDVSEKYVAFVVMQEILQPIILAVVVVVLLAAAIASFVAYTRTDDDPWAFVGFVCGLVFLALSIVLVFEVYEAVLAYTNPEMWTVQKIIQSAK